MLDNEIDDTIMRKYDKDPVKKEYLRNQWKSECKAKEVKSHQMWQAKETEMRSKMHKAETKKMANTDSEILTDSITMKLKELEHEYIKEFEKKMYAEECGKAFDESILEKVGQETENLETVLGNIRKEEEEEALIIEKEDNSDSVNNKNNDSTYCNNIRIANGKDSNKAKFKTEIPLPVRKVMKARRRLNLTSNENDQHFTHYDKQYNNITLYPT